jgi:hypothetical protein
MKLVDIILEQDQVGFTSSEPRVVDKTTGTVQWDITPTPFKSAIDLLDDALESLERGIKNNPEDIKLLKYREAFSKLKKSLKTHITRTYDK